LRRLFSTFAPGWPGVGLLLLRLVAGFAAMVHGITKLEAGLPLGAILLLGLGIAAGILLLAGLWTPVSGSLLAVLELWDWISTKPSDPLPNILLASIGVALALLGPGAWSVDARLFGWKRIDVGNPRS
jgi:putative oxidoreductase